MSGSIDTLILIKKENSSYSLIVEENFNYDGINASIYNIGATIGNGLNNDEDLIILRDNKSKIVDLVYYSSEFGGNNNGKSLERINYNNFLSDPRNLIESRTSGGTPGKENLFNNINFNSVKINEFLPDPIDSDEASMPNGEFIELYNSDDEEINLEDFYLEDKFGHKINIDETHAINNKINSKGYLTIYTNGFGGFLNNEDDEIKLLFNNILLDKVMYSSTKEGFSWSKIGNNWILTHPTKDEDNGNGIIQNKSSVKIIEYDKNAKFGDLIEIKLDIYKGDSKRNSINLILEDENNKISNEVNLNIYGKYVNYTLNVPLQIFLNCDLKFKDGEYNLKVSGLEDNDKKIIEVKGIDKKICNIKETKVESSEKKEIIDKQELKEDESQDEVGYNKINNMVVYESTDIKAKNSIYLIFIFVFLIIILFLIFKKGL